jgi:hypothetical protein
MGTNPTSGMLIGVLLDPDSNDGESTARGLLTDVWAESGDHWIASYLVPGQAPPGGSGDAARSGLLHQDLAHAQEYVCRLARFAAPASQATAQEQLSRQFARAGGHAFLLD